MVSQAWTLYGHLMITCCHMTAEIEFHIGFLNTSQKNPWYTMNLLIGLNVDSLKMHQCILFSGMDKIILLTTQDKACKLYTADSKFNENF